MSYQAKIKRYLQVLQLLQKSKFPTIAEMLDRITDSGIKVSERQLKRDIESLRAEFGLNIQYSAYQRGYFLENEELTFPYFLKLLEFSQNMDLLKSYLKEGSNIAEIMDFEDYNSFIGLQFIRDIAFSIKQQSEINLKYKRFDGEAEKEYLVQPYLLREYLNRWYVIGILCDTREIRTFGLDRIVELQNSGKRFKKDPKIDLHTLFRNIIGINISEVGKPEEIELACTFYMGNLLKTLPLHSSQKVVSETADTIVLSYKMGINFELRQRLLMMSTQAKVVKPISLKNELEEMLAQAQNLYKNE